MPPYNRFYVPKFQLESLIYTNYIKYDRMRDMIINEFQNSPEADCTVINFFIDVYSLIKVLYRREDFIIEEGQEYTLAAGIINMAAHYRNYFRTRHNTTTNIYIVSSFNNNRYMTAMNPEYKSAIDFNCKAQTDYIINNIKVLEVIVPYLPNIYFKHYDNAVTAAAIMDIMNYNQTCLNNMNPNLILSKDLVVYQLANNKKSKTIIIRPKKKYTQTYEGYESQDASYIINKNNLMEVYVRESMPKTGEEVLRIRIETVSQVHPELFSVLLAIAKVPDYGYPSELKVPAAIKTLYQMVVKDKMVLNGYNHDIRELMTTLQSYITKQLDIENLVNRFKTLDVIYLYNMIVSINIELYTHIEDLYNPNMVKKINEKFFKEYPLDLNVL